MTSEEFRRVTEARAKHAAIRVGKKPSPTQGATGAAYLQPEVAAEAIYFAAHYPRREFYVGAPSVAVIVGNRFAPGLLDRYLADTAYESQQYNGPEDPDRARNLWQPVPGDHGAHGAFDARAKDCSPQLWTSEHRALIAIGVAAVAISGIIALFKNSDRRR